MFVTRAKTLIKPYNNSRHIFHWLNIIFNKIDEDRRRLVGPDRTCAEWLLRNGAFVKWKNETNFLTDYNGLPDEDFSLHIVEVDATEASINHYGFGHFKGCEHIKKVVFHKCYYLEDKALEGLSFLEKSLLYLEISKCFNITENGLNHLKVLSNLKELVLSDLPYVKQKQKIVGELQESLPNCTIQFN